MILSMSSGLAICIVLLAMAGPAAGQEIRPTLDKIKETGVIQLGYRQTSRPFSFLGSDGQPAGFSIDLCLQVAGALRESLKLPGLKVAWVAVTPADRIVKLVKGTIDLECGSTTITFGRMEQVAFSHMISVDGGSLLATADSGIGTVKDPAGKRVGVIPNTTTEKALAAALTGASIQATVISVAEHAEGLRGLEEGRFDAYASDRILLAGLLTTAKNAAKLRLSDEFFSYERYGLMMRRGDNAFQAQVNRTLSHLYRAGLVQIYERWFGPFATASPLVKALYLLHTWPD
jgi:ABC-type amino acid transport substrate-binding protein